MRTAWRETLLCSQQSRSHSLHVSEYRDVLVFTGLPNLLFSPRDKRMLVSVVEGWTEIRDIGRKGKPYSLWTAF